MDGIAQGAMEGGALMYRMYGQIFAPRQQLLRCPDKLHPCNDAISALPPSVVVVLRKEPGKDNCSCVIFIPRIHMDKGGAFMSMDGVV
jgi:hypothetical protein